MVGTAKHAEKTDTRDVTKSSGLLGKAVYYRKELNLFFHPKAPHTAPLNLLLSFTEPQSIKKFSRQIHSVLPSM